MTDIVVSSYKSSIGELLIGSVEQKLCLMDFRYRRMRKAVDKRLAQFFGAQFVDGTNGLIERTVQQIEEYLNGRRQSFDLPTLFVGTPFQISVWKYLLAIPYGETRTYAEMALAVGRPTAIRAVGSANGANAMSLIVPCHRIVESSGGLGGYAGGLSIKKRLLLIEGASEKPPVVVC